MLKKNLLSSFLTVATANVADAGGDLVTVMDSGIQALTLDMKMVGPAYTVTCKGGNNLAILQATGLAPAGSVLVINVNGYMGTGHVGDLVSSACRARGVVGIVIDGACRDVDDIIKMKFPVFSRGSCPRGNLKLKDGTINHPIECGGIKVNPGDIIFGDGTGVVVFPQEQAQAIYDKAKEITMKEVDILNKLQEGKTLLDILGIEGI